MIGDIIEIARAKAALADVRQPRMGAHAAGRSLGPAPENENIRTGTEDGASNLRPSGWASIARMATGLLAGYA
jgi:hypothetical protein